MATETEVLEMLDAGEPLDPPRRALLLAGLVGSAEDPASLPLGSRDRLILQLRAGILGDRIEADDVCPHCQARTSFEMSCAGLCNLESVPDQLTVHADGFVVTCRPLTGRDVLLAMESGASGARERLIGAAVMKARRGSETVDPLMLPPSVVHDLARRLGEADPLADVVLSLSCPQCDGAWETTLDIGEFVWRELHAWGRRLLREVHVLARAYGWRESDVLAIPPRRRRVYLEWVSNG